MNRQQRHVLIGALIVVLLMALYPPFHFPLPNGFIVDLGYGWLFDPPQLMSGVRGTVNVTMLLIQWVGVGVVGAIGYLLMKDR